MEPRDLRPLEGCRSFFYTNFYYPVLEVEGANSIMMNGTAGGYYGISLIGESIHKSKYENGGDFSKRKGVSCLLVNTNRDATILNEGQVVGNPKDEKEVNHLKEEFKIAEAIEIK